MRIRKSVIAVAVVLLLLGLLVVQSALACRCTPGFWKNHTELWAYCDAAGQAFDPDQSLADAGFLMPYGDDLNGDGHPDTLLDALQYEGDWGEEGAARNLLRSGVAALLNEQCHYLWWTENWPWPVVPDDLHPIPGWPFLGNTTLGLVNGALGTDRHTMISLHEDLDEWNNSTCKEPCDSWPDCPYEPIEIE